MVEKIIPLNRVEKDPLFHGLNTIDRQVDPEDFNVTYKMNELKVNAATLKKMYDRLEIKYKRALAVNKKVLEIRSKNAKMLDAKLSKFYFIPEYGIEKLQEEQKVDYMLIVAMPYYLKKLIVLMMQEFEGDYILDKVLKDYLRSKNIDYDLFMQKEVRKRILEKYYGHIFNERINDNFPAEVQESDLEIEDDEVSLTEPSSLQPSPDQ
jgi:hypothetical protein